MFFDFAFLSNFLGSEISGFERRIDTAFAMSETDFEPTEITASALSVFAAFNAALVSEREATWLTLSKMLYTILFFASIEEIFFNAL